jgi:hypothetical protein
MPKIETHKLSLGGRIKYGARLGTIWVDDCKPLSLSGVLTGTVPDTLYMWLERSLKVLTWELTRHHEKLGLKLKI